MDETTIISLNIMEQLYSCMKSYVENYLIYRTIKRQTHNLVLVDVTEMSFLKEISDACFQMCFIYWCNVFGSKDRNNPIHWSNFDIDVEEFFDQMGMNQGEFDSYAKEVKEFRNKYIAHPDGYNNRIPFLDKANKAIFVLDSILKDCDDVLPFGTLRDYFEASYDKYDEIVCQIMVNCQRSSIID